MNQYAIYLRKSRADLDAEARGEGETLSKHRDALRALARQRGLFVLREYAELVSGDSIAARPQMQDLLSDVKRGLYAGVIVNDIDRLGRGDSIDQEIIKLTFAAAHCVIITPNRDIDPANASDQDMLDFSMFFARFEYRKISQRLTQGKARSAQSGSYVSAVVPFGYIKNTDGKHISLTPDPVTAPIVKQIFEWYASGEIGYAGISDRLADMGIYAPSGKRFARSSISTILHNPIYSGDYVYGKKRVVETISNGQRAKRMIKGTPTVAAGAIPAIVPRDLYNRVQAMRIPAPSSNINRPLLNPLSGLVRCAICGQTMTRHTTPLNDAFLKCPTPRCKTLGIKIDTLIQSVLATLREWSVQYQNAPDETPMPDTALAASLKRQLASVDNQLRRAFDLVEKGIYTPEEFTARRADLSAQRDNLTAAIYAAEHPTITPTIASIVPQINHVLETFPFAENASEQNALLKSVIARIDYRKTRRANNHIAPSALLEIDIYPKI